ncbi:MAG TPA: hypothetical protein PK074_06250 [Spirochaetales bacterium]|nr:hypothetical protein [Spirochaetales bacterium]HQK34309.1 hypothetical protein [Spirochaetales bacterium]HRV28673.1 hypothetical protein [Spirochaetia bacterium]
MNDFSRHSATIAVWNQSDTDILLDMSLSKQNTYPPFEYDTIEDQILQKQKWSTVSYTWIPGKYTFRYFDTPLDLTMVFYTKCTVHSEEKNFSESYEIMIHLTKGRRSEMHILDSPVKRYYSPEEFSDLLSLITDPDDKALLTNDFSYSEYENEWSLNIPSWNYASFKQHLDSVLIPLLTKYNLDTKRFLISYLSSEPIIPITYE